jgi:hypothetical protein
LARARRPKKPKKEAAAKDSYGVRSFDTNETWLIVRSSVEDAVGAFTGVQETTGWYRDVYGQEVQPAANSLLAFQLRGQAWTLFHNYYVSNIAFDLRDNDARGISERLGCQTVFFGVSDTAGCAVYILFDSGIFVEELDTNAIPSGLNSQGQIINPFTRKPYDIPPERLARILEKVEASKATDGVYFSSTRRTLEPRSLRNPYEVIDATFRDLGFYVPSFLSNLGPKPTPGQPQRIEIMQLTADDLERVDYIALK